MNLSRSYGLRLIGPNCLGVINTAADLQLNASLAPTMPPPGRVGFFCQSGALGTAILESVSRRGLGLSTFVSAGNRADVSGNDLLQYWQELRHRGRAALAQVPRVDLVVGPDAYRNLGQLIGLAGAGQRLTDTEFRSWEHYEDVPAVREKGPTAFVTVQRGCDYRCTFCIVPQTRGPERSRRLADVVAEIRGLAERGTTEVTLLGQTVNSYHDGDHDFADLLRAAGEVDGIRRLRFTSPYPTDFTPRVIAAMADTAAVCEHVHLPVQSGSNAVLRRMLRRYTRERYLQVMADLRAAMPGMTFSTDIIVGFPGETEAQFEETLSLVTEADFDDAYTFKYSVREGTPAVRLQDHVDDAVGSERLARLIEAVRGNARRKRLSRLGEEHEVLVERRAKRGHLMLARTRTNHLVLVDLPGETVGEYHRVRLSGTTGSTFTGAVVTPALAVL